MQDTEMAASVPSNNDYFYPGSIVKCVTCYDAEIQGEVLAFDHTTKMLVLKQPSSGGRSDLNNVALLNIELVKQVEMVKDCAESPLPALDPLNHMKLFQRFKNELDAKMTLAKALSSGVSKDGCNLFLCLKKTLEECTFSEQNIIVMDEITIKPPYKPENCVEKESKNPQQSSEQCLEYVKKLVKKFHEDGNSKVQTQETAKA